MLSEKHVYFDVAHTRFMRLYVDTYSGVKCRVIINLTQNVHTYRAPPERTAILHTIILLTLLYSRIFPLYRTLCRLQQTSADGAILTHLTGNYPVTCFVSARLELPW